MGAPFCQYKEIWRIAGPERPRCVNRRSSRKLARPHDTIASADTPVSALHKPSVSPDPQPHQSRTWLDDREAEVPRDIVSESARAHLGIERPPVAITSAAASKCAVGLDPKALGARDSVTR